MDRQAAAYKHAAATDQWDDDRVVLMDEPGATAHGPLDDVSSLLSAHHYEEAGWDTGREVPKDVAEARTALHARIADPAAPDDDDVADAYDGLGDDR